jgi:hypothetical protein
VEPPATAIVPLAAITRRKRDRDGVTYVLIPGAGGSAWYWHRVEAELRQRGHEIVADDLPAEDDTAGLPEYTETVIRAIGDRSSSGPGRSPARMAGGGLIGPGI